MHNHRKIMKRIGGGVPALLLLAALLAPCAVSAAKGETVTVAYIDYNSFIEKSDSGAYTGYGADYLNRIAQYTGWDYQYVDMDWPTAYRAVKEGTVDFYCVARETEAREAEFDFSLYPLCSEEMNLYTLPDSKMYYEDYAAFDGMRVGMLESSGEIDYFQDYAAEHGFAYTLVEYPMNENAVAALERGEVDAIALVNYSVSGAFKLVGNFGVSPAYLMSAEGSPLMASFSKAQEKLYFDDPTFTQTLEQTYYEDARQDTDLRLTRDEADFIAAAQPLNVAVSVDMAPIEYYDEKTGAYRGVTIDLYRRITEMTGLQFNFVQRMDEAVLIAEMEHGEVQLVGALAQSDSVASALRLTQTKAFSDNSMALITKDVEALNASSVVAVPAGYPKFVNTARQNGYTNLREFATFEACVNAVYAGKADLTYSISMCEGYLLDHAQYADLRTFPVANTAYGICLGVYDEYDGRLITIVNKCLSAISSHEVNDIIVTNTALAKPPQTAYDFITRNGSWLFSAGILIVALIAFGIIRSQKARQQATLNKKLRQHHNFLQHLYDTLPCGVFQYSYEKPHRILNYNAACARIYGYEDGKFPVVGEAPDMAVEAGTEEAFQAKFDECEATGPIMYVWPVTRRDGSRAYTESVMDLVDTEDGKVFQEVVIDVTERTQHEQLIEKRYMQELDRSGNRDEGLLYFACFDVTEQTLTATSIDVPGICPGISVEEFVAGLQFELSDLQTDAEMEDFATRFTLERLAAAYDSGHYEQSFNLCRRKDGQIQWLRSELALRHNPQNGHLICFDYIRDITDEHVTNEIVRRMALADCESFMSVYVPTGRCLQYTVEKDGGLTRSETEYGKSDVLSDIMCSMSKADVATFRPAAALPAVEEALTRTPHYQLYATLTDKNGVRQDKQIIFFYTNRENGVLAVTVSDVTEVRADEVRHAQLLSSALAAAERADMAKSQFLSRVSHEMRTPLNAIIGFIELARDADAERTANLLVSSDIAAKQLLNVINDVLDMSSIESGKMKLSNASFNFRHLLTAIANIYGTQCKQKGVRFEVMMETPTGDWLVGDELRVNQILMNLLGNAIKFTDEGYIHLRVAQTNLPDEKVFLRFTVEDTGCGMSEQMKARLFQPFEQESPGTARKYGGSGLGLSIVKSLVTMMGGTIRVESRQGEGSAFTVELPFLRNDVNQSLQLPQTVDALRILTVDDEPAEREYMSLVLKRLGVRYTSVCGGEEALKALAQSEKDKDMFNVCLVDWRMPGMNGQETTVRIREKYGKDLVVIVVSAYDFQQAGDNALEAGANLFLSKPIFQSSLCDLLMTLTGGKIAKPKEEPQKWSFAGKRVLLVEDNALNQIVAKGYLAKYNVVVDLAENGQIAVDKFLASEPGWYDAILMDIQMPVMDGYEATKVIRASGHPDAGAVQIIAQTADAFNEDIARALAAGMNAHVAKPIKPDVLAKELHKAFAMK